MEGLSPIHFDTSALQAPIDPAVARAEAGTRLDEVIGGNGKAVMLRRIIIRIAVLVVGFGLLAALAVTVVRTVFGSPGAHLLTWIIAALMVVPLAVVQIRRHIADHREQEAGWYRLSRFAASNDLVYEPSAAAPQHSASLFDRGSSRWVKDRLTSPSHGGLEVANYAYEKFVARSRMQHTACFVAFDAPAAMPSMTIVTRSGDIWGEPAVPSAAQRELKIEESFDTLFTVYSDPDRDADVRRMLTAELRESLTALATRCDVEVVGGRIFFIARRDLAMTQPAFWRWVSDLATLIDTALRQTAAPVTAATKTAWDARRPEREALFALPKSGRSFAIGCLVIVLGLVAAAASTFVE